MSYEDLPPYRTSQGPPIELVWTFTPPGGTERELTGSSYWRSGSGTVQGASLEQVQDSPPGRYVHVELRELPGCRIARGPVAEA